MNYFNHLSQDQKEAYWGLCALHHLNLQGGSEGVWKFLNSQLADEKIIALAAQFASKNIPLSSMGSVFEFLKGVKQLSSEESIEEYRLQSALKKAKLVSDYFEDKLESQTQKLEVERFFKLFEYPIIYASSAGELGRAMRSDLERDQYQYFPSMYLMLKSEDLASDQKSFYNSQNARFQNMTNYLNDAYFKKPEIEIGGAVFDGRSLTKIGIYSQDPEPVLDLLLGNRVYQIFNPNLIANL